MRKSEAHSNGGFVRVDYRVVVVASVVREANGLVVGLEHTLERVLGLHTVLVDLDGPIVDLGDGDDFNVIAETGVLALAHYVMVNVLGHVLSEVVGVLCL